MSTRERHFYSDGSTKKSRAAIDIHEPTTRAHLVLHLDPVQARRLLRELAQWNESNAGSNVIFSFQTVGDLER